MTLSTQTPLADDVWSKLVGGTMSVFRRIFPKTGVDSPVDKIKDIPAETKASYSSSNISSSVPVVSQQTNAAVSKSGSDASIYFPHIGGVFDYFLNGIQTALLPEGMGPQPLTIGGDGSGNGDIGSGENSPANCKPEFMEPAFGAGAIANQAACIASAETVRCTKFSNTTCLQVGGTGDYSVGLFAINLMWNPWIRSKTPDGLKQAFVAAGLPENSYCPDAFSSKGIMNSSGRMISPCVVSNQKVLDVCVNYFMDPVHSRDYAATLQKQFGWGPWATHGICGL